MERLSRQLRLEKEQTALEQLKRNTAEVKLRDTRDNETEGDIRTTRETSQLRSEITAMRQANENLKQKLAESEEQSSKRET